STTPLGPGNTAVLHLTVTANGGTPTGTVITNTVTATESPNIDSDPANNVARAPATVTQGSADLSITKTITPDVVYESSYVTATIIVGNGGPSGVTRTVVTDTPTPALDFVSASATGGWNCGYTGVLATESVTCTIGSFPAHVTDTITVVWFVRPGTAGLSACDLALIQSESGNDPNSSNNQVFVCAQQV